MDSIENLANLRKSLKEKIRQLDKYLTSAHPVDSFDTVFYVNQIDHRFNLYTIKYVVKKSKWKI